MDWWAEFLRTNWKKSVNRDMWDQTYGFFEKSLEDPSMSWYDENGAWPSVIDEFVEFVKGKRGGDTVQGESMDAEQ
jgi:DCN1-like protein 1/2